MNILLTGGAGFIGSHTAVELLNAGHDVIIVDNLYNSSAKAVERVEELTGKRVKFYCADACDHDAMDRIFSENKVDAVIHFAAYKAVGESVAKPLEYYLTIGRWATAGASRRRSAWVMPTSITTNTRANAAAGKRAAPPNIISVLPRRVSP